MRVSHCVAVVLVAVLCCWSASADEFEGSQTVVDSIPRFVGNKTLDFNTIGDQTSSGGTNVQEMPYVYGIVSTFFYGLILLILAPIVFCCVACCGCCNKKKKSKEEVTPQQRQRSMVILVAILAICCGFSFGGYVYNEQISAAMVSESDGMLGVANTLALDAFDLFDNITGSFSDFRTELDESVVTLTDFLSSIPSTFENSTDDISQDLTSIAENLRSNAEYTSGSLTVNCTACYEAAASVDEINQEVTTAVDDVITDLNTFLDEVNTSIVNEKANIDESIDDIFTSVDDFNETAHDAYSDIYESTSGDIKAYEEYRRIAVIVLFLLPILGLGFVVLGYYSSSPRVIKCNTCNMFCMWMAMALLLTIHIPLSLLIADSCLALKREEAGASGSTKDFLDVCVGGASIDRLFNITEATSFRDEVEIPSLNDSTITEAFQLDQVASLIEEIEALNSTAFGASSSEIDSLLNLYSTDTEYNSALEYFTRQNISSANTANADNSTAAAELKSTIVALINVESHAEGVLNDTLTSLYGINESLYALQQDVLELNQNVTDVPTAIVNNLFDSVDAIVDTISCRFLGNAYTGFKEVTCTDLVTGMAGISLFFFLIILFSIPALCFNNRTASFFHREKEQMIQMEQTTLGDSMDGTEAFESDASDDESDGESEEE